MEPRALSLIDEIRGIAEGVSVPFHEVWTLNRYEGWTDVQSRSGGAPARQTISSFARAADPSGDLPPQDKANV